MRDSGRDRDPPSSTQRGSLLLNYSRLEMAGESGDWGRGLFFGSTWRRQGDRGGGLSFGRIWRAREEKTRQGEKS